MHDYWFGYYTSKVRANVDKERLEVNGISVSLSDGPNDKIDMFIDKKDEPRVREILGLQQKTW